MTDTKTINPDEQVSLPKAEHLEQILAERDSAVALANLMRQSSSWRLTRPLRFFARLVRYGFTIQDRQRVTQALRYRYPRMPLSAFAKGMISFIFRNSANSANSALKITPLHTPSSKSIPQHEDKHEDKLDYVLPDIFRDQKYIAGDCVICGKQTQFFYPEAAFLRESLNCQHCRSTSRYRSIARGLLRTIKELTSLEAQSLATLPQTSNKRLRVYDTQPPFYYNPCAYPLPDLLKATGWIDIELSNYKPNKPMGTVLAEGITNQNLECLTFADESLDVVITSDVMEHVRLDDRAHREIYRVLKVGGIYIFTVPHNRTWEETLIRVQITDPDDPSKDVHLLEPEYHGDANSDEEGGVLAYRTYGRDIERFLENLGFEVQYSLEDIPANGILLTELYYCRKLGLTR